MELCYSPLIAGGHLVDSDTQKTVYLAIRHVEALQGTTGPTRGLYFGICISNGTDHRQSIVSAMVEGPGFSLGTVWQTWNFKSATLFDGCNRADTRAKKFSSRFCRSPGRRISGRSRSLSRLWMYSNASLFAWIRFALPKNSNTAARSSYS